MNKKVILFDTSLCSGCYNCQISCKDEHVGNDWRPYAAPQPNTGQFWLKLEDHVRGSMPKVKLHYIAKMCAHCEHPACMEACPVGAITKREDGLVLIDPDACVGCGACAAACPVGAIYENAEAGIFQKCTGCAHLLDNGYAEPRCVEACHTGALRWVDAAEAESIADKKSLVPEELGPSVFYRNIPAHFLAGAVVTADGSDVIRDAVCRLSGGAEAETKTDSFGDFWFEGLQPGQYRLTVEAPGCAAASKDINLTESVNLGELRME